MLPSQRLSELAARKATLRRNITRQRFVFSDAAGVVTQPLRFLDRWGEQARRIAWFVPWVILPLGYPEWRRAQTSSRRVRRIRRWGRVLRLAIRGLTLAFAMSPAPPSRWDKTP